MLKCEIVKKGCRYNTYKVCKGKYSMCVKVGEAEKIDIIGNVDTINSTRFVGTVSLMLF